MGGWKVRPKEKNLILDAYIHTVQCSLNLPIAIDHNNFKRPFSSCVISGLVVIACLYSRNLETRTN